MIHEKIFPSYRKLSKISITLRGWEKSGINTDEELRLLEKELWGKWILSEIYGFAWANVKGQWLGIVEQMNESVRVVN